jgi:Ca2+:H+ antiporter
MVKWLWRAAWLLVPLAAAVRHFLPGHDLAVFTLACLALVPLAHSMGNATESLAEHLGPATGSLLNATFGNAAELIVGIVALLHGHIDLVKGSLTGSILGNLLLVAGASILAGGLRQRRLRFNRLAAGASVTVLFLSVVAMAAPALLAALHQPTALQVRQLSVGISVVLLVMYGLSLLFQLHTHADAMAPAQETPRDVRRLSAPGAAVGKLFLAGGATAVASELLVSSLSCVTAHLPEMFVGVVIVAVVGNAAEHSTAVTFGWRGDFDVALGIPWESSKQIALFVAPVLVFVGLAVGAPMDLAFRPFEVAAIGLAVISTALYALDGETHWLEGAFLIATYAVLALSFFYMR